MRNPQKYQMVNQAIANKNNPMELFKQVTSGFDENTKNAFFQQAEQIGFSKDYLEEVKKILTHSVDIKRKEDL